MADLRAYADRCNYDHEVHQIAKMIIPLVPAGGFTCKRYDAETKLCSQYVDRPRMCSEYPYDGICVWCGFMNPAQGAD